MFLLHIIFKKNWPFPFLCFTLFEKILAGTKGWKCYECGLWIQALIFFFCSHFHGSTGAGLYFTTSGKLDTPVETKKNRERKFVDDERESPEMTIYDSAFVLVNPLLASLSYGHFALKMMFLFIFFLFLHLSSGLYMRQLYTRRVL